MIRGDYALAEFHFGWITGGDRKKEKYFREANIWERGWVKNGKFLKRGNEEIGEILKRAIF